MSRRVVCVSRAEGAGGEAVARLVAERLGFRCIDEEIVLRAAEKAGRDPGEVADVERRKSRIRSLLEGMTAGGAVEGHGLGGATVAVIGETAAQEELRGLIGEAIEEAAAQGDVVISAHAASFALAGRPGVLRIFVTASPETRAEHVAKAAGLEPKEAAKRIKDSDAARADYLRRFYGVELESPMHYDLIVNTDTIPPERAATLVAHAAGL